MCVAGHRCSGLFLAQLKPDTVIPLFPRRLEDLALIVLMLQLRALAACLTTGIHSFYHYGATHILTFTAQPFHCTAA